LRIIFKSSQATRPLRYWPLASIPPEQNFSFEIIESFQMATAE
jgi:hypothetical protein